MIIRVSVSGENDVLTKCTKQNLEYIINKKNSIAISLTGKKGKGRKVILEKKVKAEKEKVGVVSEVKETVKDINQIEPNKPMCNNTVVVIENDTMKMRNTKNATREAACTDVCCSVI